MICIIYRYRTGTRSYMSQSSTRIYSYTSIYEYYHTYIIYCIIMIRTYPIPRSHNFRTKIYSIIGGGEFYKNCLRGRVTTRGCCPRLRTSRIMTSFDLQHALCKSSDVETDGYDFARGLVTIEDGGGWKAGERVYITGMKQRIWLNGLIAELLSWDSVQRLWSARLEKTDERIVLQLQNLAQGRPEALPEEELARGESVVRLTVVKEGRMDLNGRLVRLLGWRSKSSRVQVETLGSNPEQLLVRLNRIEKPESDALSHEAYMMARAQARREEREEHRRDPPHGAARGMRLIELAWLQSWLEYHADFDDRQRIPPAIPNESLVSKDGVPTEDKTVGVDYVAVGASTWAIMQRRYGGGPEIARSTADLYDYVPSPLQKAAQEAEAKAMERARVTEAARIAGITDAQLVALQHSTGQAMAQMLKAKQVVADGSERRPAVPFEGEGRGATPGPAASTPWAPNALAAIGGLTKETKELVLRRGGVSKLQLAAFVDALGKSQLTRPPGTLADYDADLKRIQSAKRSIEDKMRATLRQAAEATDMDSTEVKIVAMAVAGAAQMALKGAVRELASVQKAYDDCLAEEVRVCACKIASCVCMHDCLAEEVRVCACKHVRVSMGECVRVCPGHVAADQCCIPDQVATPSLHSSVTV